MHPPKAKQSGAYKLLLVVITTLLGGLQACGDGFVQTSFTLEGGVCSSCPHTRLVTELEQLDHIQNVEVFPKRFEVVVEYDPNYFTRLDIREKILNLGYRVDGEEGIEPRLDECCRLDQLLEDEFLPEDAQLYLELETDLQSEAESLLQEMERQANEHSQLPPRSSP